MSDEINRLSTSEIKICLKKTEISNQLAFGIMLAYFKQTLSFPDPSEKPISTRLISDVALYLDLKVSDLSNFDWNGRNAKRYRIQIKQALGFRQPTVEDSGRFVEHLIKSVLPDNPSQGALQESILTYLRDHKIACFSMKQLKRYVQGAKKQFERNFLQGIYESLDQQQLNQIDSVLKTKETLPKEGLFGLSELKKSIPGAKLKHVEYAIQRIDLFTKLKPQDHLLRHTNRKLLHKYYDRVLALSPSHIAEFSPVTKYATMAIFSYIKSQYMRDALTDTLIKLIHRLRVNAEKQVDQEILSSVKRVDGKFDILEKLALVNAHHPKDVIENVVYPEVSRETLLEVINDLQHRGTWYQQQVQTKIHSSYIHGNRAVIIKILQVLSFQVDHRIYKPLVNSIEFIIARWDESDSPYYSENPPLSEAITEHWKPMVIEKIGRKNYFNKYNYELAVLEHLKILLGYKAIWIAGSYRYRDPNQDTPYDFDDNKQYYFDLLDLPLSAKTYVKRLKKQLSEQLVALNQNIPTNSLVKIKQSTLNKNLTITPSEAQLAPKNIDDLQQEIIKKWSSINLIDVLKETDLLINFTEKLESIASHSKISGQELRKRLLLCLYGIGSNTGLKRMSIANGDVSHNDLFYVKKRFIHSHNVRNAIRHVVNSVLEIRDPDIWGEATTTVACDSTQINAWDQNLINEWHHRYKGKGVMIYWHVDKKALCIYSQLKNCSSSEVGSMIKGVIDHDTEMNLNRVFTDTHGQSVIGFAVSHLLGFSLLPRLKAINKQKLAGVTSQDKYKYENISLIMKGTINWKIIEQNYNEVVKYMVALKLGLIEPSVLVKRFSQDNYHHPVYKALMEIGKANKSIFLCQYIAQEPLRIEINEGLNVVERLNYVMDFIFYGKLGELRNNISEEQELSILCLHLLQACLVYINTLLIQQVLSDALWHNRLTPEDYRALTPLLSTHINPYGLFPVDFDQRIAIGNS